MINSCFGLLQEDINGMVFKYQTSKYSNIVNTISFKKVMSIT